MTILLSAVQAAREGADISIAYLPEEQEEYVRSIDQGTENQMN